MSLKNAGGNLALQFRDPQKSERWAMYRVIMPESLIIQKKGGPEPPILSTTKQAVHGTSQSVDVALLSNGEEEVFLEAKAIGNSFHPTR